MASKDGARVSCIWEQVTTRSGGAANDKPTRWEVSSGKPEKSRRSKAAAFDEEIPQELVRALVQRILDLVKPRHRLDDGYTYLKVTRPLDGHLRRELRKSAENVHIFDTDPAVHDLVWLRPWSHLVRRLIVLDAQLLSIDEISRFTSLESLSLAPATQVEGRLDAAQHPSLRDLAIEGYVPFSVRGSSVSRLVVGQARVRTVAEIEGLEPLVELHLHAPRRWPRRLSSNICSLTMSGMRLDAAVSEMSGLEGLEELTLVKVNGMRDLRTFSRAAALKRL